MKRDLFRQLLILTMVVASAAAMAQYQPEEGDTIYGSLPAKYYAPWWVYDDWTLTSTEDSVHECWGDEQSDIGAWGRINPFFGMRYYTDRPLRVLGLAGAAWVCDIDWNTLDTSALNTADYFEIREIAPENDSIYRHAWVEWHLDDPARTLQVPVKKHRGWSLPCGNYTDTVLSYSVVERYFERPVIVDDSFYVGGSNNNCMYNIVVGENNYVYDWPQEMSVVYGVVSTGIPVHMSYANSCPRHEFLYWEDAEYWQGGYLRPLREHRMRTDYLLIFPIIDPSYTPGEPQVDSFACPTPTGLGMLDRDTGAVWLQWQAHPDQSAWTVGYCEAGLDFDSVASTMDCSTHELVRVSGLRPDTEYEFRVQAHCKHNDGAYLSPWSDPLFVTTDTVPAPDTTGILLPDAPGEVLSVEYFDLLGRPLAQPPTRGLYIRRETTTSGVSTRKIVRQ